MPNTTTAKATEAAARITGKRYCSHHQGEAAIDAGSYILCNKSRRWVCDRCQAKSRMRQAEIQASKSRRQAT
jgi:hypothetical protein